MMYLLKKMLVRISLAKTWAKCERDRPFTQLHTITKENQTMEDNNVKSTEIQEEVLTEEQSNTEVSENEPAGIVDVIKQKAKNPLVFGGCIALLIAIVALIAVMALRKSPLEQMAEKIADENNYRMTMEITGIPFLGSMTVTTEQDGNITHTPAILFEGESYTVKDGKTTYQYTKEDDEWVKEIIEDDDDASMADVLEDDTFAELFNPDNYVKSTKDKTTIYTQKDDVEFDSFKDVVITIEKDKCTIEMKLVEEGMTMNAKIIFQDFGKIKLTLPKVD